MPRKRKLTIGSERRLRRRDTVRTRKTCEEVGPYLSSPVFTHGQPSVSFPRGSETSAAMDVPPVVVKSELDEEIEVKEEALDDMGPAQRPVEERVDLQPIFHVDVNQIKEEEFDSQLLSDPLEVNSAVDPLAMGRAKRKAGAGAKETAFPFDPSSSSKPGPKPARRRGRPLKPLCPTPCQDFPTCSLCQKKFLVTSALQEHIEREHGPQRPFVCDVCGLAFLAKSSLRRHSRRHTGTFTCETCARTFSIAADFKIHVLSHTGERPHVCDCCGDAFSRREYLKSHMRRHTGEKPYMCKECDKRFAQKSALNTHMKVHHRGLIRTALTCRAKPKPVS